MLPVIAPGLREPMAELGAALFTADRALRGVDGFLVRVDAKRLARRLGDRRKESSARAYERARSLEGQIACVDRLRDRRSALGGLAVDLPDKLETLRTAAEIDALRERVVALTDELDEAFGDAARSLDALSYKLMRTRRRGIYRSGRRYAVLFVDEVGEERLREFETLAEARGFRTMFRLSQERKRDYHGATLGPDPGQDAVDFTRGDGRPRGP